jgi:hypothetical protein
MNPCKLRDALRVTDEILGRAELWCEDVYSKSAGLGLQQAAAEYRKQLRAFKYKVRRLRFELSVPVLNSTVSVCPERALTEAAKNLSAVRVREESSLSKATMEFLYSVRDAVVVLHEGVSDQRASDALAELATLHIDHVGPLHTETA